MEVFKYLFQLFANKNNLTKQISLFSLVGIMVILCSNFTSILSNSIFEDFYIAPMKTPILEYISLDAVLMIGIYLLGYMFKLINNVCNNTEIIMPTFSMNSFTAFIKTFPLLLIWQIYFGIIAIIIGLCTIFLNIFSTFYVVILCFIPFVYIILCKFLCNYEYKSKYFNPIYIFKTIKQTALPIVSLTLQTIILGIIFAGIMYLYFILSAQINPTIVRFGVRFFGVCIIGYLGVLTKYIYIIGIAKIVQSKHLTEEL